MSGSSSSPTNTTTTSTQAQETNLAATNTQGVTIVGTGNKITCARTVVSTDAGAVQAGVGVAQAAVSANTGLAKTVESCSFNFANHALDVLSAEQVNSATLASNFLSQGSALENQFESGIISVASAAATAQNEQLANTSETLANIAQANDTTQAAQSTKFAQTALLIAAGAAIILVLLTRKG